MSREIAFYFHIVLTLFLVFACRYAFFHVFTQRMLKKPVELHDTLWEYMQKNLVHLRWYFPLYPVFLNLVGWGQVIFNRMDLYLLVLYSLLAWLVFSFLHLAFKKKLFWYGLVPILVFSVMCVFLFRKQDSRLFIYTTAVWVVCVRTCVALQAGEFFGYRVFLYMMSACTLFGLLCLLIPQARDYEVWLALYLFGAWIVFLLGWVVEIYRNMDTFQRPI